MRVAAGILIAVIIALVVAFFSVPLWKVAYFEAESLKYEAISYIERGQPGETVDEEYIVPYSFPIIGIIIKNAETPVPDQLAFSEEDEARLAVLIEQYEGMIIAHVYEILPSGWERKPLWERAGRRIIAAIPLSSVWGRYIPAFKYGITPEDGMSLLMQVGSEIAALKSKKEVNSPAIFEAYVTFRVSGHSYSSSDAVSLKLGAVETVEFRVYEINMDEDEWSWEYEVKPAVKWVTHHKKVTLFRYLLHTLESP